MTDELKPTSVESTFIAEELASARKTLLRTQIVGALIVLILGIYLISISARFTGFLQPTEAAEILTGFTIGQIQDHRTDFVNEVGTRVPEMIQKVPDYVLEKIPQVREKLETTFNEEITKALSGRTDNLESKMDEVITANTDTIKAIIASGEDTEAIATMNEAIRVELIAYLKETPVEGETIDEQIAESLMMMKNVETRLHHLATGTDLSPTEKKTRHAVAVIVSTMDKANLQPLELPTVGAEE